MFRLTNLVVLNLENNMEIEGRLPTEFALFTDLRVFSISGTNMRAKIPDEYRSMTKLEDLRIAGTQVGGSIPYSLTGLTNLKHLDLSGSRFRQSLPDFIGEFPNLGKQTCFLEMAHNDEMPVSSN